MLSQRQGGTHTVILSSKVKNDTFRELLPGLGEHGTIYHKNEVTRNSKLKEILDNGFAMAKRSRNRIRPDLMSDSLVQAIGGPNGAGEFRIHIGGDEGTLHQFVASELWDL